jgi:glutamyl-tRNA reductase
LSPLTQRTLRASKRIRTESDLGRRGLSLGAITVKKAFLASHGTKPRAFLIVGAGQIAESVAKNLRHQNAQDVTICSRTFEKAITLANMNGYKAVPFSNLDEALLEANVVIAAASVDEPVITERRLSESIAPGAVLVDLGVPPNIAPSAKNRADLRVIGIDELLSDVSLNAAQIAQVTPKAMEIAVDEVHLYARDCSEREAAPCIEALVQQSERVRRQNLEWALTQIPVENTRERKLLEDLSIRIARGMISDPINNLKTDFQEPEERAVLSRFFRAEV